MTVAAVVHARDPGEQPQLLRLQNHVRSRDAEHPRMEEDLQAVLQPQGPELVLAQLADEEAARLIAKLCDAFVDEALIE
jgi:hypothetical protein